MVEKEGKPPVKIIGEYLTALERSNPEYFTEVQRLVDQCSPMDPRAQCLVLIPVVGFGGQGEESIFKTLEVLNRQEIKKEKVEIVCFVNRPPFADFDQTAEIIRTYSEINPELQLSLMKGVIPRRKGRSRPLMGRTRALLTDAALIRIYCAFKDRPESKLPVLALADSDTENIAPKALQTFIATFEQEPNTDLIIGELRWESREYPTAFFPTLFVGDELMYQLPQCNKMALNRASKKQKLTEEEVRALTANVFSGSFTKGVQVNIAFRPEAYAACGGGFDSEQDINELDFLVRIIAFSGLSKGRCNIKAMNGVVKVNSSSRRALLEYLEGEGRAPIQQWRGSFGLRVQDPARTKKPELLGIIPLEDIGERGKEDLALAIEGQINSTFEDYTIFPAVPGWYQDAISEVYIPALASIGLRPEEYSIQSRTKKDGAVQLIIAITDSAGLLKRLQDVQREKIKKMKLASRFEEVEVEPEQIVDGYVVTSPQEPKRWAVFDRASVIYGDDAKNRPSKIRTKILKLPI